MKIFSLPLHYFNCSMVGRDAGILSLGIMVFMFMYEGEVLNR